MITNVTVDKAFIHYGKVLQSIEMTKNVNIPENSQSNCYKSGNERPIGWKKVRYLLTIYLG